MLCDRIAILADGRLAALGSSLDLKTQFGIGYTLTIVRDLPPGGHGGGAASGGGHARASRGASRASSSTALSETSEQEAEVRGAPSRCCWACARVCRQCLRCASLPWLRAVLTTS